jgi:DNA polymerase-3 subunit epsilon
MLHGALLDAELLAEVYLELCGGRQPGLVLEGSEVASDSTGAVQRIARPPRSFTPSDAEINAHQEFMAKLTDPIWNK